MLFDATTCGLTDLVCMQLIPRLAYWADMDVYNVTGSCSDLSGLPNITFMLGTDSYTLPPSAWVTEVCPLPAAWIMASQQPPALRPGRPPGCCRRHRCSTRSPIPLPLSETETCTPARSMHGVARY